MKKFFGAFILFFLYCSSLFADKVDSLLAAQLTISRPYLVVNLVGADCIMCKSSVMGLLRTACKRKIVLISDDKSMQSYLQRNMDLAAGYHFIYNKELSQGLAIGAHSTVSLVRTDRRETFILDADFDSSFQYLKDIINADCALNRDTASAFLQHTAAAAGNPGTSIKGYHDSLIRPGNHLTAGADRILIFNEKTQIGLIKDDRSGVLQYFYPDINGTTQQELHRIVQRNSPALDFLDTAYNNKVLKFMALPKAIINSCGQNDLCFNYNASFRGVPLNDSNENIILRKQCFVAWERTGNSNPFDINGYKAYTLIDSIHTANTVFVMQPQYGYELKDGSVYMPFYIMDATGAEKIPRQLAILKLKLHAGKKATLERVYKAPETIQKPVDYYFRLNEQGHPVVVDKGKQTLIFLEDNSQIALNAATQSTDSLISYLYDIAVRGNTIRYVAVRKNKTVVSGIYNYKNRHSREQELLHGSFFSDARIYREKICTFSKNEHTDELIFGQFELMH